MSALAKKSSGQKLVIDFDLLKKTIRSVCEMLERISSIRYEICKTKPEP